MVETESAGDHFSFRMSALDRDESRKCQDAAGPQQHVGGHVAHAPRQILPCRSTLGSGGLANVGQHLHMHPRKSTRQPGESRTVAGRFEANDGRLVRVFGREPQRDGVDVTLVDRTLRASSSSVLFKRVSACTVSA